MQCVEECAVGAALVHKVGAVVTVPIGVGVVQCVEECAIGAVPVGAFVAAPGVGVVQCVEECTVFSALVDAGGAVVVEGGAVFAVHIGEGIMQCV